MALRQIKHYQRDEVLRKKSKPVDKIDERVQILITDMIDTMYQAEGVGLAAPQVGILKRIVVIDIGEGVHVLINPEIVKESGEQIDYEGCLSLPGIRAQVKRPAEVIVKALDRNGKEIDGANVLCKSIVWWII